MVTVPAFGGCQCGEHTYVVKSKPFVAYTCHCKECQKLSASAFNTCMQIPTESFEMEHAASSRTRIADSGNSLTTWFCANCGTALYSINSARPSITTVYVGSLSKPEDILVNAHIWLRQKLPWVLIPESHRAFAMGGDWTEDYAGDIERYKPSN